jgi:hypothetical protein
MEYMVQLGGSPVNWSVEGPGKCGIYFLELGSSPNPSQRETGLYILLNLSQHPLTKQRLKIELLTIDMISSSLRRKRTYIDLTKND